MPSIYEFLDEDEKPKLHNDTVMQNIFLHTYVVNTHISLIKVCNWSTVKHNHFQIKEVFWLLMKCAQIPAWVCIIMEHPSFKCGVFYQRINEIIYASPSYVHYRITLRFFFTILLGKLQMKYIIITFSFPIKASNYRCSDIALTVSCGGSRKMF